jgi:thioredoxin 1
MALTFTDDNFKEAISEGVTVVDFWAEWCGPCRMIAPIIDELYTEYEGQAKIGKLDVDNNPQVSFDLKIRSIPTIMIFKDGEMVDKQVGLTTKAKLEEKIKTQLITA